MNKTDRVMNWAKSQGAVVCNNPKEKERLISYVVPAAVLFPDIIKMLCAVYVYRMSEQTGEAVGADGMCWKDVTSDIGTLYAIGISTEAMDEGPTYAAFVFLHELAHIVTGHEHNSAFHDQLGSMLDIFNKEYGTNIANDFFDWTSRYDCRLYRSPGPKRTPVRLTGVL